MLRNADLVNNRYRTDATITWSCTRTTFMFLIFKSTSLFHRPLHNSMDFSLQPKWKECPRKYISIQSMLFFNFCCFHGPSYQILRGIAMKSLACHVCWRFEPTFAQPLASVVLKYSRPTNIWNHWRTGNHSQVVIWESRGSHSDHNNVSQARHHFWEFVKIW